MEFTPRIKQILLTLLKRKTPVMEQDIANAIGVSKRTVQREFEYLEKGITEYGLSFVRKKGAGVWLEGKEEEKEHLLTTLEEFKQSVYSDKEMRRKYLLFELLKERIPHKLYFFGDLFGVSEATISGDIEAINGWLSSSRIEIIKKPGYGVVLKGSEKDYRQVLQRFVSENVENQDIRSLLYKDGDAVVEAIGNRMDGKNIYELLNSEILDRVSTLFMKTDEPRLKKMTENSYIALIIHISIALDRIFKGEVVEENQNLMESMEADEDYELAVRIIQGLAEEFQIEIPDMETVYILLHIKGAKLGYSDWQERNEDTRIGAENVLDMIDKMIDVFDAKAACALKCDEELIHGLLVHLEPTLIRLENEMNIYNPLLEEIKSEYSEVFLKSKRAAQVITQMTGYLVNEEETGYLTMHFGAALVRLSDHVNAPRAVEIGVICASGFGVARLMMTKLKNQLKQNVILKAYGKDEITPFIISKTDFFVSSMNMEGIGVDYIRVSPLITAADLQQIQVKAAEYGNMPMKVEETDFTRKLDEINFTVVQIKGLLKAYKNIPIQQDAGLEKFLAEASLGVTKNPQSGAVLAAEILAREQVMTQIFPEMGFALFHCRSKTIKEALFFTCRPDMGNCFTDSDMKQIRAAVVLLMPKDGHRSENADILGYISSSLVDNKAFLETIFGGSEENVREQLQKILKNYFNDYLNKI